MATDAHTQPPLQFLNASSALLYLPQSNMEPAGSTSAAKRTFILTSKVKIIREHILYSNGSLGAATGKQNQSAKKSLRIPQMQSLFLIPEIQGLKSQENGYLIPDLPLMTNE